jgi:RsmE family RNA methyltransferase
MNRIVYAAEECVERRVIFRDHRAVHIREVLRLSVGDSLRVGEVNGSIADAEIEELGADGVTVRVGEGKRPPRPFVDVILALPRPKVLRRLIPQLSALGVDRLYLTNAAKVERFYFDSKVLEAEMMRDLLIEGLVQSGHTALTELRVVKRLKPFVEDEAGDLFPDSDRWVLHPGGQKQWDGVGPERSRCVLAIGPEGGWEPFEVELFASAGFQPAGLGDRILRSDTACVLSVGLASLRWNGEVTDGGS